MFPGVYYPKRYFPEHYFGEGGVFVPPTPPDVTTAISGISGTQTQHLGNFAMFGFLFQGSKPLASVNRYSKLDTAGNTACVITIPAVDARKILVSSLSWSYSDTPTGGKLTISGGPVDYEWDIIAGGPGQLPMLYLCDTDTDCVITLAAAGGSVVGKLNVETSLEL